MIPKIKKILKVQRSECEMCGSLESSYVYHYTAPISKKELIICKKCATREYYGTKAKNSKNVITKT